MKNLATIMLLILLITCGIPRQGMAPSKDTFVYEIEGQSIPIDYKTKVNNLDSTVELEVKVAEKIFDIKISGISGLETFDGHNSQLSTAEHSALTQAALEYKRLYAITEDSSFDQKAVFIAFDFLAQSPQDFIFQSQNYQSMTLKNDGVSCLTKGSKAQAEWTTTSINFIAETIVVGSNMGGNHSCMGRCGASCDSRIRGSWTKDCLDYDACSLRNAASGGPMDANCGDEFRESMDDWFWGVIKGCNGQ